MRRLNVPVAPLATVHAPRSAVPVAAPPSLALAPAVKIPELAPPPIKETLRLSIPLRFAYSLVTAIGDTTLYTVPHGQTLRLYQVQLSNAHTSDVIAKVLIGDSTVAAGYLLFFGGQLTKRWERDDPVCAYAGDDLKINLSAAASVHVTVDYVLTVGAP